MTPRTRRSVSFSLSPHLVGKQTKKKVANVCQAFCSSVSAFLSVFVSSAPEEEGERGAAGGCDPGLREDSHGEEQPPEGSRQDGQISLSPLHRALVFK